MIQLDDLVAVAEVAPRKFLLQYRANPNGAWVDIGFGGKSYNEHAENAARLREQYKAFPYEFRVFAQ